MSIVIVLNRDSSESMSLCFATASRHGPLHGRHSPPELTQAAILPPSTSMMPSNIALSSVGALIICHYG